MRWSGLCGRWLRDTRAGSHLRPSGQLPRELRRLPQQWSDGRFRAYPVRRVGRHLFRLRASERGDRSPLWSNRSYLQHAQYISGAVADLSMMTSEQRERHESTRGDVPRVVERATSTVPFWGFGAGRRCGDQAVPVDGGWLRRGADLRAGGRGDVPTTSPVRCRAKTRFACWECRRPLCSILDDWDPRHARHRVAIAADDRRVCAAVERVDAAGMYNQAALRYPGCSCPVSAIRPHWRVIDTARLYCAANCPVRWPVLDDHPIKQVGWAQMQQASAVAGDALPRVDEATIDLTTTNRRSVGRHHGDGARREVASLVIRGAVDNRCRRTRRLNDATRLAIGYTMLPRSAACTERLGPPGCSTDGRPASLSRASIVAAAVVGTRTGVGADRTSFGEFFPV